MLIAKYLDPKNDFAFKKIFGEEKHKRIPIAFLNAVFNLQEQHRIIDLEFLNTVQIPEIAARKESIVDVLVKDQSGCRYIVEMQVAKVEGFEKRAQYYAAKTYCSHFYVGEPYQHLKKVIFLAITSYIAFPNKEGYKSDHVILDNKTYQHDLRDFSFTFVELPKFTKKLSELETIEDKWYYFLKHADESNQEYVELIKNPEIKEAYEVIERVNWTEEEYYVYERAAMAAADAQGIVEAARKEGLEEGKREGLEKGKKEGLEKGKKEATHRIVHQMLKQGMDLKIISDLAGLTLKEIQHISETFVTDKT